MHNNLNRQDINNKIEYFENLKSKRDKWNSIWDDLRKYVCPQTSSNKEIFDSTSIWSREQLASGLQSLLVNPATKWFSINLQSQDQALDQELNKEEEIAYYQQICEQTILDIFNNPGSNFYNQIHEFFLNLAAFGTSVFYLEENLNPNNRSNNQSNNIIFFRNINLRECYFEEDKFGFVGSMYRLFSMSIKSAANKWPEFSEFKEKLVKTPDEQIEILHIVTPSNDKSNSYNVNNKISKINRIGNKTAKHSFTSEYIYLGENKLIAEGGYSYFPFLVTRWIKEEGESLALPTSL